MAARRAHNPEAGGSSPPPATMTSFLHFMQVFFIGTGGAGPRLFWIIPFFSFYLYAAMESLSFFLARISALSTDFSLIPRADAISA